MPMPAYGLYGEFSTTYTNSTAISNAVVAGPNAANKKMVITDVFVSSASAVTVSLTEGSGGLVRWQGFTAAGGGLTTDLNTGISFATAGSTIFVTTIGAGSVAVTVTGFMQEGTY